MTSVYFLAETIQKINKKNCMTTSESKGRFFLQNESIRIDSHNESNRVESRKSSVEVLGLDCIRWIGQPQRSSWRTLMTCCLAEFRTPTTTRST